MKKWIVDTIKLTSRNSVEKLAVLKANTTYFFQLNTLLQIKYSGHLYCYCHLNKTKMSNIFNNN